MFKNASRNPTEYLNGRSYRLIWYTAAGLALAGVAGIVLMEHPSGWWLFIFGMICLVTFSLVNAWQNSRAEAIRPEGGVTTIKAGTTGFFLTVILASEIIPSTISIRFVGRLALLVTGTQALFLAISVRRSEIPFVERVAVPAVGHALLSVGTVVLIISAFVVPHERVFQGVLLWYAVGLSALALDTFWMGQRASEVTPPPPNSVSGYWEQVLLGSIIIGVSALAFIVVSSLNEPLTFEVASLGQPWTFETGTERGAAAVVGMAAVTGIATLAAPESAPGVVEKFDGTGVTIGLHAMTTIVLLNALLVGLFFLLPVSFGVILVLLLGLVTIAVLLEYTRIGYVHHGPGGSQPPQSPSLEETPPVTVVVVAYNEAEILPESIEQNLDALTGLQFLLVPAGNSTDETVELAEEYQASYPERIRVVEGTTGSKAGDLNQVWGEIETPYVLLLDADETANLSFVSQALSILRESPDVGIVQGRKVARHPSESWMARFVTAERRLNTWIDHQFINDVLGASHFAGSAAVVRHEAPQDIGGWSTRTLTEDIDLTVRLYVYTEWDIAYRSQMTIGNLKPATTVDLIRQRRRWARGWVEVTWRYTGEIIRSRESVGRIRSVGLLWELFTTVGAPFYLVSIAITGFVFAGLGPTLPVTVALALAILLFPARGLSFSYAAVSDPTIPVRRNLRQIAEVWLHAYLWILLLWVIQLHVIYLQLAGAPKRWKVTDKGINVEEDGGV